MLALLIVNDTLQLLLLFAASYHALTDVMAHQSF